MNRRATQHGKRACQNCGAMVSTNEAARAAHRASRKCADEAVRLASRRQLHNRLALMPDVMRRQTMEKK
jgi:hypothetical protein